MLKNLKVELMKEIYIKENDVLVLKDFNKRGNRLYFVDEYFDETDEEIIGGCHTAMELIPLEYGEFNQPETTYTINPVYIYTDEKDEIIRVVPLCEAFVDNKTYFNYWKDLFKNFTEEISDYVSYDENSIVDLLAEIIKDYSDQVYYYADGNSNEFSLEVLDRYKFIGNLSQGIGYGSVIITNMSMVDKCSDELIMELPDVNIEYILDEISEDDIEYTFANYLNSLSKEDIGKYILSSIDNFMCNYSMCILNS